jgi:hypothetical protein
MLRCVGTPTAWNGCTSGPAAVGQTVAFASRHRDVVVTGTAPRVAEALMSGPGVEQVAVVVAREQVAAARRELTAWARQAGPGVAMAGGGGFPLRSLREPARRR